MRKEKLTLIRTGERKVTKDKRKYSILEKPFSEWGSGTVKSIKLFLKKKKVDVKYFIIIDDYLKTEKAIEGCEL